MSNAVATLPERPRRELAQTEDVVPILDTTKFEHMQRIATVMARSSMVPSALCEFGPANNRQRLSDQEIVSNCFLVVNQAVRWGMDPFAVAQCVSVVHGKLCYEGKLVAAVLDAKLGLKLHHHLTGETGREDRRIYLSDEPFDDETTAKLAPGVRLPDRRLFDGSVTEWKTSGNGTPWTPKNFDRMLIYRGTRDWCRVYEPAIMLGVYTPDEMLDLTESARASRARDVTPERRSLADRLTASRISSEAPEDREGFDREIVNRSVGASEEQTGTEDETSDEADEEQPEDPPQEPVDPENADGGEIDPDASDAEHEAAADDLLSDEDRSRLIRYARDMMNCATADASATVRRDRMGKSQLRWRSDLDKMSPEAVDIAKRIFGAVQHVATDKSEPEETIRFLASEIGCGEGALTAEGRE